jgi:hypothetical protein
MRRLLIALALMSCTIHSNLQSQEQQTNAPGHYLFAWTGDAAHKGNDFLAVIDADLASKSYGQLMTTLATDLKSVRVHHTEYVMPASGMLFAIDHDAGRTFIFDLRDPFIRRRSPRLLTWRAICIRTPPRGFPMGTCWRRSNMFITARAKGRWAEAAAWWRSMIRAG